MSLWILAGVVGLGIGIVLPGVPLVLKAVQALNLPGRVPDLHHGQGPAVPRLGGLALVAAYIGIELFRALYHPEDNGSTEASGAVILGSLAMFGLGFWDDVKPLGAKRKLAGQVVIAAAVCAMGIGIERLRVPVIGEIVGLKGWGVLVTVAWLVGMTNLINLIDGVDGLASGICLMLMALLAYVGHQSGGFELVAAGMAGALLAFLYFNFPPARIYLGDGGAYFLGFQIGILAILSSHKGTVFAALVAPLFVLALPILDVTLAIVRRGLRGLPIFRPDRRHIHHRLLEMGLSRRRAVLSLYAVTLVFLAMGFAAFASRGQLVPLLLGITLLIVLLCAGKMRFSREWFAVGRVLGNSVAMRRQVHYTLALTRWLALEGDRCASVEELWANLVFAAQRLGFTYVALKLADGRRAWGQDGDADPDHSARLELQAGRLGVLELKAAVSGPGGGPETAPPANAPNADQGQTARLADSRTFGIVSDLLAEGWVQAASRWHNGEEGPLTFRAGVARKVDPDLAPVAARGPSARMPSVAVKS